MLSVSKFLNSNAEEKTMANQVQPPAMPPPARQARGEQYARALSEFEELQRALDDAVHKLDDAIAHIKVLEGRGRLMLDDNHRLTGERDWYKAQNIQMWTRLQDAGSLIMKAMQAPDPDSGPPPSNEVLEQAHETPNPQVTQALEGLEKELLK